MGWLGLLLKNLSYHDHISNILVLVRGKPQKQDCSQGETTAAGHKLLVGGCTTVKKHLRVCVCV